MGAPNVQDELTGRVMNILFKAWPKDSETQIETEFAQMKTLWDAVRSAVGEYIDGDNPLWEE